MTKKPRKTTSGMNHTVSLTDREWDEVRARAKERGKSAAAWLRECALTVDLSPKTSASRSLALDADQQHTIARAMSEAACLSMQSDDASSGLAEDVRALLAARLRAMARDGERERAVELLRRVFGERRTAVIAAAYMPEADEDAAAATTERTDDGRFIPPFRGETTIDRVLAPLHDDWPPF